MKTLSIVWQRLLSDEGNTCPRCHGTGQEIESAVQRLKTALAPLGVVPVLKVKAIDQTSFLQAPLQSNQVLIAGQTIEHWLGGQTGSSPCCAECGDNDCRTLEVGGQSYEVVPEALLVRAGLIAASRLLDPSFEP